MKTYSAKPSEIEKKWVVVDAQNVVFGALGFYYCNTFARKA